MSRDWIADRMRTIEISGIRRVFDLARSLKAPVNLSIGQPHFDVPEPIKSAAKKAIDSGANGYTPTQGIPELRDKIRASLRETFGTGERELMITSGTAGGLLLAMMATVNPGDEVIFFDPYFVMYPHMVSMVGGRSVIIDIYPRFQIDVDQVRDMISDRTKMIIVNSPSNPSGVVVPDATLRDLASLAAEKNVILLSDEIYHAFAYDAPFRSPAEFNDNVLVVDGLGKTYGMTGWRMGFAHGPKTIIEEMTKLQQFTFVCAPSMAQHAAVTAWDYDTSSIIADYRRKRNRICDGLRDRFEFVIPGGAFYVFPKAPGGQGSDFVEEAVRNNLLIIPGSTFSGRDSHFRVSFAASDETIDRGIGILNKLAGR